MFVWDRRKSGTVVEERGQHSKSERKVVKTGSVKSKRQLDVKPRGAQSLWGSERSEPAGMGETGGDTTINARHFPPRERVPPPWG